MLPHRRVVLLREFAHLEKAILFRVDLVDDLKQAAEHTKSLACKAVVVGGGDSMAENPLEIFYPVLAAFKPVVLLWPSNAELLDDLSRFPVVVLDSQTLEPRYHEDTQRMAQHFHLNDRAYTGDAKIGPALWLAFFKLRNMHRVNRASLYLQTTLTQKLGVFTLGDYLSVSRGGLTRGQIRDAEYVFGFGEVDFFNAEGLRPLFEGMRGEWNRDAKAGSIRVNLSVYTGDVDEKTVYSKILETRADGTAVNLIAIAGTNGDVESFAKWGGLERVVFLPPPATAWTADDVRMFIDGHLVNALHHFYRTPTAQRGSRFAQDHLKARVDQLRASLLHKKSTESFRPVRLLTTSLGAFADALELGYWCSVLPTPTASTQVFGNEVLFDLHPQVANFASTERRSLFAEPLSILGNNDHTRAPEARGGGVDLVAVQNTFKPTEAFSLEDSEERGELVTQMFDTQYASLFGSIRHAVLDIHADKQRRSAFRFTHFHTVVPMIRSVEIEAALSHLTTALYTHPTDRSLFRLQCGGEVSPRRAAAWAVGVYAGQLMIGGPGTEVAEIWCDPDRSLTDEEANEVAVEVYKESKGTFVYPLERHVRLKALVSKEGKAEGVNGYLEALSLYLRQPR